MTDPHPHPHRWRPSLPGRLWARGGAWTASLGDGHLTVERAGRRLSVPVSAPIALSRGRLWSTLSVPGTEPPLRLTGLPARRARELSAAVGAERTAVARLARQREAALAVEAQLPAVCAWARRVRQECSRGLKAGRWLTAAHVAAWADDRPRPAHDPGSALFAEVLAAQAAPVQRDARLWLGELADYAAGWNRRLLTRERAELPELFDRIEDSPLTEEQLRAVVTGESRVQLLAAAGSGKTATLVARAAYAVRRGHAEAEEILLLAFNADAATELQERVDDRFRRLGLDPAGVRVSTFHALGLRIIREATGHRPELPAGLGSDDTERLRRVVGALAAGDPEFAARAEAFREDDLPGGRGGAAGRERALLQLLRSAIVHSKNNGLGPEQLRGALDWVPAGERARDERFLALLNPVRAAWDRALRDRGEIDFEDMLGAAAELVEAGRWAGQHRLILVDEAQDSSRARARLVRALLRRPGSGLFQVGDDWQSVNRFAGADLSVMTRFEDWYGSGVTLRLERTFRFSQELADRSSAFVSANPAQLPKRVRSDRPQHGAAIQLLAAASEAGCAGELRAALAEADDGAAAAGERLSVLVLGRYRRSEAPLREVIGAPWAALDVSFSTVHAAKGRAADLVVIAGLTAGAFPSDRADDPALRLAMPGEDDFPHAEERRLCYVALTRARRRVLLLTVTGRESPFVAELTGLS